MLVILPLASTVILGIRSANSSSALPYTPGVTPVLVKLTTIFDALPFPEISLPVIIIFDACVNTRFPFSFITVAFIVPTVTLLGKLIDDPIVTLFI